MDGMNETLRLDDFLTYTHLLSKLVFRIKNKTIKNSGLKNIHVIILFYLTYKGPMTFKELVKSTLEDKAAISKALKTLKEKEIILYSQNSYNEKITLTDKGETIGKEIISQSHEVLLEARKEINDEDALIFMRTMKTIIKNLEEYTE